MAVNRSTPVVPCSSLAVVEYPAQRSRTVLVLQYSLDLLRGDWPFDRIGWSAAILAEAPAVNLDQPVGFGKRQRPKEDAVDDAEDRGGRAGGEREGRDRDDRESWGPHERADRVADVAQDVVEPRPAPDVGSFFPDRQRVAEASAVFSGHRN